MSSEQRRVQFDFEIDFSNGGGIQGQGFRLDLHGDTIDDTELADTIVRDLRLLMVGAVRIRNRRIIREPHKRGEAAVSPEDGASLRRMVDLSHTIEHGMIIYKGLPAPLICDHLSREASRAVYAGQAEFHIGRIDMVANTGTYIDSPFHRYADGADLCGLTLDSIAELDGVLIRVTGTTSRSIGREALLPYEVRGKAVLIHTGWAMHWRTDQYFENHPFLDEPAAQWLQEQGARLVGIDSYNIDDITNPRRPVHTILLGANIPIVEHLRGLEQLPPSGFKFSAVPPKVKGMGTFPVRAYATL